MGKQIEPNPSGETDIKTTSTPYQPAVSYPWADLTLTKEKLTALPSKYRGNAPEIRDLSVYEHAMERSVVSG